MGNRKYELYWSCLYVWVFTQQLLNSWNPIPKQIVIRTQSVAWFLGIIFFFSYASFKIQVWNLAEIFLGRLLLVMLCWMTSGMKQLRFDYHYSLLFPEGGGNDVHSWMWSKSQPKLNLQNQQKIMHKQVCYPVKWSIFDLMMCFLHLKKEKFW